MKYVAVCEVDNNILIRGDGCCTNLHELYMALTDKNTTEIEIKKEFANEYFTYSALNDFISYSVSIFSDVRIVVEDSLCESEVDAVENLRALSLPDELIYAIQVNPSKILSTIRFLCDQYLDSRDESTIINNKMASMSVHIEDLNSQIEYLEMDKKKLEDSNNELYSKLHALVSRTNFRYEKTINPDEMFITSHNNYNHILYIKEITRVHYTDTLLYYLSEILKTLYEVPVRVLVIEPYYSYGRELLYPYLKPHWNLKYKDVYSGDIIMSGYQPQLMNDVLKNSSHVNYLIILDRGGYRVPHVQDSNITYIYTASDLADVHDEIEKQFIISYDESTLYIPYIENFNDLSSESKIQKYSSMSVMKTLINYLEEVNE